MHRHPISLRILTHLQRIADPSSTLCSEAALTAGYTPLLAFQVPDLQAAVQRLLPLGAEMDGGITFARQGRIVALRNPDGHMMTLFEREAS